MLGMKYGYSGASVRHFEDYVRSINRIRAAAPHAADLLLEGHVPLSISKTEFLARKTPEKIEAAMKQLINPETRLADIFPDYKNRNDKKPKRPDITVKDTPAYDPDAQVAGLIYTIPSWIAIMDRVSMTADFNAITVSAHRRLRKALHDLKNLAETMLSNITEDTIP